MKTKVITTIMLTLFLAIVLNAIPVSAVYPPDQGLITLDDTTTTLHYYDAGTVPQAWAWNDDLWYLTIATSYDAEVEIKWFDYYPTNDVYELYIDGDYKGKNPAGGTGKVQLRLATGSTYKVKILWRYYQTNQPPISGGSWYDITFKVLGQYKWWFKASGGGESYSDASGTYGYHCTLGIIGMSLEASYGIGDWVPCKGSGTFVDHDEKIKISFEIEEGAIRRGDYLIYLKGTAKVFDINNHYKTETSFRFGLVDDEYGRTNRFDLSCYGRYWHGTLEPESEVTVWVWEA